MTGSSDQNELRIGLDLGGSKIEGILMSGGEGVGALSGSHASQNSSDMWGARFLQALEQLEVLGSDEEFLQRYVI